MNTPYIKGIFKMKKSLAIATLAILSTGAFAQSNSFKAGFYGGVDAGYTKVSDETHSTASALVSAVGGSAAVTQNTGVGTGRIFAGYKATENFDFELGYFKAGNITQNIAGVAGNSVAYTGNVTIKTTGYDYSVLARPSISSGWNNAFLRVGGQHSEYKGSITLTGTSTASISSKVNGNGYLFGAGYDFNVANNIDVRAQATRLMKIAGESDSNATVYQIGVIGKF
jgi:Outer membrane protein beta-barrel domain